MNSQNPPKLPTWLIEKLGYLRCNPALFGDLLEEFRSGSRSQTWYWRQTAVVLAAGIRTNVSGTLLKEFAVLFAVQALFDLLLWRVRGALRMGNFDYPGLLGAFVVIGFFTMQLLRNRPIGGVDAGAVALLYVLAAPWLYVPFPNDMSLVGRICIDFLQLAFAFGVASLPAGMSRVGNSQ
jgi:hypothetical protein